MIKWSVMFGILGIFGAGVALPPLSRWASPQRPQHCWFLGLAALFPAWLTSFMGLLDSSVGKSPEVSAPVSVILSSSVALLGVILTEVLVRHLHGSGLTHRALTYWLLGLAALLPAWCIALLSLVQK